MYTKTKINNLTKNNKILYEKDGWKLTAIYDYEGLIGEAIFDNHFTKTCLRNKEVFFKLTDFSLTNKDIKYYLPIVLNKLNKLTYRIFLPVYILKNEKLKYFRQIEKIINKIKVYDQLNEQTWIRKNDIPNDIIAFLNGENFFVEKFYKKYRNIEIYKMKNVYNNDNNFKFKNNNDYFILNENILINNINKNKNLLLMLLAMLKHYKYKGKKQINQIIHEIFENKHTIFL